MTAAYRNGAWLAASLLAALLAGCQRGPAAGLVGYIEGEYLYLAAPQAGYLKSLDAPRGTRVAAGQPVFAIADDPDAQALDEAVARAGAAREKVANLRQARRAPEIAALEANLEAAQAARRLARTQLAQQEALARANFVSPAALDAARSAHAQAQAQVDALRAQLANYRGSVGRDAEVRGAQAELDAAGALVAQKRWAVERKAVSAPVAGEVSETYYRPGEWVAAGAPVASVLPDTRRRLRFFVGEQALAAFAPGVRVEASCDGCREAIRGVVDFVAAQAEYTPPVIYSRESREKLVFRVEAAVDAQQAPSLRPGLPIDVRRAAN